MMRYPPDGFGIGAILSLLKRYVPTRISSRMTWMFSLSRDAKGMARTPSTPGAPAVLGVESRLPDHADLIACSESVAGRFLNAAAPRFQSSAPWGLYCVAIPILAHHAMPDQNRCPRLRPHFARNHQTTVKRGDEGRDVEGKSGLGPL
jgi:hypothetical protein